MRARFAVAALACVVLVAACGSSSPRAREAQAIQILQSALPTSTREAQGLPFGGWVARTEASAMTVTLPLNADADVERGLRAARAVLVRGAVQVFSENSDLQHLTIVGTLPYGVDQTEAPLLIGNIDREDIATWDGASDQLGLWEMRVP